MPLVNYVREESGLPGQAPSDSLMIGQHWRIDCLSVGSEFMVGKFFCYKTSHSDWIGPMLFP